MSDDTRIFYVDGKIVDINTAIWASMWNDIIENKKYEDWYQPISYSLRNENKMAYNYRCIIRNYKPKHKKYVRKLIKN